MAFAASGRFISHSDTNIGDPWTSDPTTDDAISSGDLLIIEMGFDNLSSSDGDNSEIVSCAIDPAGSNQSFTKIAEHTNSEGAQDAGATVSLWYLQNSNAYSAGTAMRIDNSGSVSKGTCQGWRFTMNNSNTLTVESTTSASADNQLHWPSLTITGLTSREYLWIYAAASEGSDVAWTPDSGWTQFNMVSAAGGPQDSRIQSSAQYLIATGTGQSSIQPQGTSNSFDRAAVMAALWEDTGGAPPDVVPNRLLVGVGHQG